jgi:hypothetical protein
MVAIGILTASVGFIDLAAANRGEHPGGLGLGLAICGTLFVAIGLATYLVLAELQAQTSAALGSKHNQTSTSRRPESHRGQPASKPVGNELRIGRGDSWS